MTFHHHDGSGGVARFPISMSVSDRQELDALLLIYQRTESRIAEILFGTSEGRPRHIPPHILPKSGLRQAAPGVLLFKGGRHAR